MLRTLVAAGFALGFAFPALAQPSSSAVVIQDALGTGINQGSIHQGGTAPGTINTAVLTQINALLNNGQITQEGYTNILACVQSGSILNNCVATQMTKQ